MKGIFKGLVFIMVGVLMFSLVGCGNSSKKKSDSVTTSTTTTEDKTKDKDNGKTADKPKDAKVVLKDVPVEGKVTDEEKSKIVDLTEKCSRLGIDTDYTKDTVASMNKFFDYTTPDAKTAYDDDKLAKTLEGQKKTKQIFKVQDITYKKITKNKNYIIVDFTAKTVVSSHTNPNISGKTFNVVCQYMFDKNFKIAGFTVGEFDL